MTRFLIIIASTMLAFAAAAAPEVTMIARNGQDSVRLWDLPCVHAGTLALLRPDLRDKVRKARAMIGGRDFFGCWMVEGDSAHLLYEDGDQGLIPLTDFKMDDGA